jgi:hypothetical protein
MNSTSPNVAPRSTIRVIQPGFLKKMTTRNLVSFVSTAINDLLIANNTDARQFNEALARKFFDWETELRRKKWFAREAPPHGERIVAIVKTIFGETAILGDIHEGRLHDENDEPVEGVIVGWDYAPRSSDT